MAFLFGRNRQRSAQDLVRSSKDLLQKLGKLEPEDAQVVRVSPVRNKNEEDHGTSTSAAV